MIVKIFGKLVEKKEQSVTISVNGICYEVLVPVSILERMDSYIDPQGNVGLITYHYLQLEPARGFPTLVGFLHEIERDFFLQFIKVSGIGPRAAVKALNKPIALITQAIEEGDLKFLKELPGIGTQRAKEIIAKLQGKIGRFGLIQDTGARREALKKIPDWQEEALQILLQLQYKRLEALEMINKALERSQEIVSTEDLLNEIYKQKVKR